MTTNNYFKKGTTTFAFDDTDYHSIVFAYQDAVESTVAGKVTVWRMPSIDGDWRDCEVVGYRSREAILSDLKSEPNEDLEDELAERDAICKPTSTHAAVVS